MTKVYKHIDCFRYYGTVPTNIRWSWSGRSADGKAVSVTLWQDLFEDQGRIYKSVSHKPDSGWYGSKGHKELIANLQHARDHCDGKLKVIIAIAVDPKAKTRKIKECFPKPEWEMTLTHLDPDCREFIATRTSTYKVMSKTDLQLRNSKKPKSLKISSTLTSRP